MVKRSRGTILESEEIPVKNPYDEGEDWHFNNCSAFTQISKTEIEKSRIDNVVRSGTRRWSKAPEIYQASSLPLAIAKLNDYFTPQKHHMQNNIDVNSPITINDQLCITINKNDLESIDQQPTPEGIHQDNTEMSSVMMIGRENVEAGGGISRLWSLDTPTGYYSDDEFEKMTINGTLLSEFVLEEPFDTIFFNDRKLKHEVRYFNPKLKNKPCSRSVLVNFVRKPLKDGTDNFSINNSFYRRVFDKFDTDASGDIDFDEFKQLLQFFSELNDCPSDDQTFEMFLDADLDGNGTIDFDEFIFMMENSISQ